MSSIVITNENALARLQDSRNLVNLLKKKNSVSSEDGVNSVQTLGRSKNVGEQKKTSIPEEMKSVIGALAKVENAVVVGKNLGVNQSSALRLSKGLTTPSKFDENLAKDVEEKVETITKTLQERALNRLGRAMDLMTDEEIANAKLREKSGLAKDMAVVFEKLGPKLDINAGITFNVYVPKQKEESDYPSVVVDAEIVK